MSCTTDDVRSMLSAGDGSTISDLMMGYIAVMRRGWPSNDVATECTPGVAGSQRSW